MYRVQHTVLVTTGSKPFVCFLDGPVAHLDVIFEGGIITRGWLDIEQPVMLNQLVKDAILSLGISGHILEPLLDGGWLDIPEIRASDESKNAVIFRRKTS